MTTIKGPRRFGKTLESELRARDARVVALLKRIEWAVDSICPCCRELYVSEHSDPPRHAPDCELAALIRELS